MSLDGDMRRREMSAVVAEAVDLPLPRALARTLQAASARMRTAPGFPFSIVLAVFGAALVANGLVLPSALLLAGGAALLAAALVAVPRRRARQIDRSAVRLALRLASFGERTVLVERGSRMRVVRLDGGAAPRGLQYVGALQKGALILARER
jgi:hypothetical protein